MEGNWGLASGESEAGGRFALAMRMRVDRRIGRFSGEIKEANYDPGCEVYV
jgi:hypothetical protein